MKHLLNTLENQVVVEFSGRINVLDAGTRQLLGEIILNDGEVFRVRFKNRLGIKALFDIYLEDLEFESLQFVVEPEIIEDKDRNIHFPFKTLLQKLSFLMEEYQKYKDQKPPKNLKLIPVASFIEEGEVIDEQEFKLLETISDYNLVEEIYLNSPLMEYEITKGLVSLRKKGALKVVKVQTS